MEGILRNFTANWQSKGFIICITYGRGTIHVRQVTSTIYFCSETVSFMEPVHDLSSSNNCALVSRNQVFCCAEFEIEYAIVIIPVVLKIFNFSFSFSFTFSISSYFF